MKRIEALIGKNLKLKGSEFEFLSVSENEDGTVHMSMFFKHPVQKIGRDINKDKIDAFLAMISDAPEAPKFVSKFA